MGLSEATGWVRPQHCGGSERFSVLRQSGKSPTTGLRVLAPISAAPVFQALSEVRKPPCEGTSDASHQIASVSSDRSTREISPDPSAFLRVSPSIELLPLVGAGPGSEKRVPTMPEVPPRSERRVADARARDAPARRYGQAARLRRLQASTRPIETPIPQRASDDGSGTELIEALRPRSRLKDRMSGPAAVENVCALPNDCDSV
jgi:hypothetical protein